MTSDDVAVGNKQQTQPMSLLKLPVKVVAIIAKNLDMESRIMFEQCSTGCNKIIRLLAKVSPTEIEIIKRNDRLFMVIRFDDCHSMDENTTRCLKALFSINPSNQTKRDPKCEITIMNICGISHKSEVEGSVEELGFKFLEHYLDNVEKGKPTKVMTNCDDQWMKNVLDLPFFSNPIQLNWRLDERYSSSKFSEIFDSLHPASCVKFDFDGINEQDSSFALPPGFFDFPSFHNIQSMRFNDVPDTNINDDQFLKKRGKCFEIFGSKISDFAINLKLKQWIENDANQLENFSLNRNTFMYSYFILFDGIKLFDKNDNMVMPPDDVTKEKFNFDERHMLDLYYYIKRHDGIKKEFRITHQNGIEFGNINDGDFE